METMREPDLSVFTLDYPGARAERALPAFVRETFPEVVVIELPVPKGLAAQEIDDCLARCRSLMSGAAGPGVVLAYCSGSVQGRHLAGSGVPVVSISGTAPTAEEWVERFAGLVRNIDQDTDLSALDAFILPEDGRHAAAVSLLATMHHILEMAMRARYGEPLHRAVRETMTAQLSWMAYVGSCVLLGPSQETVEEVEGDLGDGSPELAERLRLVLKRHADEGVTVR